MKQEIRFIEGLGKIRDLQRLKVMKVITLTVLMGCLSLSTFGSSLLNDVTITTNQEKVTVKGIIKDEAGVALPGVSVTVQGTTKGVVSSIDGEYSLTVDPGSTILFSFIGYKDQEITATANTTLNISMNLEATALDAVVVVGYGTQKKASITGSITSVKGEVLEKSASPNLSNSIGGQLSGVIANVRSGEPGEDDATILIRGKGTLGSTSALIVIDGIADRGGFSRLNPEDIESMTVLKDASAAIYGARAANGVILITTKRGNVGKPTLNISSSVGWSQPTRVPEFLDSYRYAIAENEFRENFTGEQPRWSDDDLEKFRTGSDPLTHPNTDWFDVVFKDWSMQHNQTLSLRGGTDKIKYFMSAQYLYQDGNFKDGTNFDQFQYRANIDVDVTDELTMSVDLAYRMEDRDLTPDTHTNSIWGDMKGTYPYLIGYFDNGLPGIGMSRGRNLAVITTHAAGTKQELSNIYNTKLDLKYDLSKITDGLYIQGYGVMDKTFESEKQFRKIWLEYAYNPDTEEYEPNVIPQVRDLNVTKRNSSSTTLHARLGYERTFGDHEIGAFIAYEQNESNGDYVWAFRNKYQSDAVDQLFAGADDIDKSNDGSAWATARVNYFGRVNYSYQGKYIGEVTLRRDGSQNFPKENRFGTFPGASVGWRISEEPFFNIPKMSYLKVRASWGQMGNDNVDPYQYLTTYKLGISDEWINEVYFFGTEGEIAKNLIADQTPNPNITWETATTMNIGFDANMFNSKLTITAEAFSSKRKDILIARNASVPTYTGLTLPKENLGKVKNSGIEAEVGYNGQIGSNFKFNVKGNFTYARNEVIYLDEPAETPEIQKQEGNPIDSWLLYESDGLFQTQEEVDAYPTLNSLTAPGDVKLLDINEDGEINVLDQKRLDYGQTPEIMYGLNLGGDYKGISISLFLQGQARAFKTVTPGALNTYPEFFEGRWQEEGDNKYPRVFYGPTKTDGQSAQESDFWLRSAAFIRLKNAEVSYTLPKSVISKIGFDRARFYLSGSNLFSIDKIKLFDPELESDGVSYPLQRIIRAGVNVSL